MNLLGYFAVCLCAVLAVYGQNTDTPGPTTITDAPTSTPATELPTSTLATDPSTTPATNPPTTTPATKPPTTTPTPEPPTTTPSPESPTTMPSPEPPITTLSPEPPTTTPSPEPPTTTPSSEPPTTIPTPEPPTTTPSPEPPTTASPEPPTSTPAPAPPPSDELNLYVNNSGAVCILMNMDITLTLEYENATGMNVTKTHTFNVNEVKVDEDKSSNCTGADKENEEQLVALFYGQNELFVQFNQKDSKVSINLLKLTFTEIQNIFPDAKKEQNITLFSDQKLFEYSSSKAYKCDAELKVDLKNENKEATKSSVTFKEVKVKAFRTGNDVNFGEVEDCVQDDKVSDIVPIAVGCALAALVVIVLIAYLVGRRQKRQRGYESV